NEIGFFVNFANLETTFQNLRERWKKKKKIRKMVLAPIRRKSLIHENTKGTGWTCTTRTCGWLSSSAWWSRSTLLPLVPLRRCDPAPHGRERARKSRRGGMKMKKWPGFCVSGGRSWWLRKSA